MDSDIVNYLTGGICQWSATQLIIFTLVTTHCTIISVTLYLHRHQAHRALTIQPPLAHLFRFWLWLTTGIVTKEWVAIHRKHHARCDTEEDPHSPQILGIKQVLWRGSELYRDAAKNKVELAKFGHGTPDDWLEHHLYGRFHYLGISMLFGVYLVLFGTAGICVWAVQMLWIPFFAAGVINGIGHYWGYRNFECADAATNIIPWGLLVGGEELHNNHHTYPSSAKLSNQPWEIDLGWYYIKLFQIMGLVKVKKIAPKPTLAAEKLEIDKETLVSVITHRFHIMAQYSRQVLIPVLKDEIHVIEGATRLQFRNYRKILIRNDNLLDSHARSKLEKVCEDNSRIEKVYQYKLELQKLWLRSTQSTETLCESLRQWCHNAEQSGEQVLVEFARQMRQYGSPLDKIPAA